MNSRPPGKLAILINRCKFASFTLNPRRLFSLMLHGLPPRILRHVHQIPRVVVDAFCAYVYANGTTRPLLIICEIIDLC